MRLVIKIDSEAVVVNTETEAESENEVNSENVFVEVTEAPEVPEEPDVSEEPTTEPLIMVDDNLYMSETVYLKTLDDCYSMLLSIRNVVLFWFLLWCILKVKSMIHSSILKYMRG